jgi:transposase
MSATKNGRWSPLLALLPETVSQREHGLREVFNKLRYVVRYGVAWRAMPNDLRPGTPYTTKPNVG